MVLIEAMRFTSSGMRTPGKRTAGSGWGMAIAVFLLVVTPIPTEAGSLEWADWILRGDLGARFDSNVNRASSGRDEEWDFSIHPSIRAGRALQLAERTRLIALATLGGRIYSQETELHALDGGARLAVVQKLGLGDAPRLRVFADGGYQASRVDQRSGPRFSTGVELGKRFSSRFDAEVGYHYALRWGEDGPRIAASTIARDVFDQQVHVVHTEGRYLLTQRLILRAGFQYRRGDFESNARHNRFSVLQRKNVEAVAQDEAFGGWVYRVDGSSYVPSIGLNLGVTDHASLDLGYAFQYGEGGGLEYKNHALQATVLLRY